MNDFMLSTKMMIMIMMTLLLLLLLLISEFSAYFCSSHSFYDKSFLPSDLARDG